ncbi:GMC oxidoreductase [Sphaerobolus stellatus SS14]|uniref:GMC oxidoreductase n=1 Tax=Sphaerobolus stellatus (strain SS14) TaxID=990650 RepID=A0A0C9U3I3_SPHS4|nr:GMC oxidoreductase [Sphaerobolus stellatus SS14]
MADLKSFIASDIENLRQLCAIGRFDYIIIGSGIGGGILADQLASRQKKVLLIEKGQDTWSTHVVNTARPSFARGRDDSAEGNETIFNNLHAPVQITDDSEGFVGGPLFTLGGRSNVWGLWIPRADVDTLSDHFPSEVANELKTKYFNEAFKLVTNNAQVDNPNEFYPHGFLDDDILATSIGKINSELYSYIVDKEQGFKVGPVAIEVNSPAPYRFPQGAFSATTALLNRIYSRDKYLTVLMGADVLHLDVPRPDEDGTKVVRNIAVRRTSNSQVYQFPVIGNTKVILSAGTLCTADIALRSGLQLYQPKVGRGLIDHAAWSLRVAQQVPPDQKRHTRFTHSPMLFQAIVNLCGTRALLSITINYNFFLAGSSNVHIHQYFDHEGKHMSVENGRKAIKEHEFNTMAVFIEFGAHLDDENYVLEDGTIPPTVRLRRSEKHDDEESQEELQVLCTKIRDAVLSLISGREFSDPHHPAPRPTLLGAGIYAHEVGTMRMPTVRTLHSGKGVEEPGVVDTNLKFNGLDNLYVSDLSVFPYSTPANPTLTLTSIVLRLAEHLAPSF